MVNGASVITKKLALLEHVVELYGRKKMKLPNKEEKNAIDSISKKSTRERFAELDIPELAILIIYHKARRPKNFDAVLNESLDATKEGIQHINKIIDLTYQQLEKYEELKQSMIYHKVKQ